MKNHTQLTYAQRCQIEVLLKSHFLQINIAKQINAKQPVISREIRRNSVSGVYSAEKAQNMTEARRKGLKRSKMDESIKALIKEK